jgi:hypothetical protein
MATSTPQQFSALTIKVTKSLNKDDKKDFGIFITPHSIVIKFVSKILRYAKEKGLSIQTILEPACGTCAIVEHCDIAFTGVTIDAVEYNDTIYEAVKDLSFANNHNKVAIHHADFMAYNSAIMYDLTLSNPPYVVCEKGYKVPSGYSEYIIGRPNIFGLFILKQLSLTRVGGLAAFIIPKSFMNSSYYGKIRDYIKATCNIVLLEDYALDNDFIDTQQATFGLILHKMNEIAELASTEQNDCPYSVKIGEHYAFIPDALALKELLKGSTTLAQLGFAVRTGNIVWNQCKAGNTDGKPELTADSTQTVLIYDSNITKDHKIKLTTFKNEEKHQYIKREGRTDTVLAVKRGHGNSAYKLNYALIDMTSLNNRPYLCENHINEIYPVRDDIKKGDASALFIKIMKSFENPKTQQFIDLFLGNNGLSKTELETLFPIY